MKKFVFLFILIGGTCSARMSSVSIRTEKGFFSVGLLSGYSESHTLNTDATYSKFSGTNYGFQLEISLSQNDSGAIRFLGTWSHDSLKEKAGDYKLQGDGIGGGLKFYANPYCYLQVGYGEMRQKYDNPTLSYTVKNKYLSSAIGFDMGLTDSLLLGMAFQYKTNPIKKTNDISANSFSESGQVFLVLTWSPPITIIQQTVTSGR
jgi:hypothetical protein